ncbi:MAG: rhodanese-like domain-containing protein [Opitutaceae bacterium]|jgi:rhodanese-related sulfurtransferase
MKLTSLLCCLLGLAATAWAASSKVPAISHADLAAAIAAKSVTILDVNGSSSFKEGRIPGALDYAAQKAQLAALLPKDKNALVVAYCGNEHCTAYLSAATAAQQLGYTNVKHYAPGIDGWKQSGAKLDRG